ncbi:MAG: biotin--[acetyl-CoA-carboxylase] ligase [Prevotellaceae bacterium]|nr:biotin--[acetyl-CoA-carboxylase] ligase [Prevotellaceae bacterium]
MELSTTPFPYPLITLEETDSTNAFLQQLCDTAAVEPAEYTTVTTRYQSAGKGQRGNSWESEAGKNLLFSFLLYPRFMEARAQFALSQIVCLAVQEELSPLVDDVAVTVKWPNDIYCGERKICGMLIENDLRGHLLHRTVVGIGLNVNQTTFLSDAPNPVSLYRLTGHTHELQPLLTGILQRVKARYEALRQGTLAVEALSALYARTLFRREGFHSYRDAGGLFQARLVGVEPDGRLRLQDAGGRLRLYLFKEVQYVL